jgi:hypothetical protein
MLSQLNSLSLIGLFHKNLWNFFRVIDFLREMQFFFLVGGSIILTLTLVYIQFLE